MNIDGDRLDAILTVTEDNRGRYHYTLNRDTGIAESISDISRDGPEGRRSASGRGDAYTQFIGEISETDKDDSTTEDQARRLHDRTPRHQRAHRMFKLMGMQPIDRLFRMPLEVFGGLNSHGEFRPGMYLHAKAKVLDAILF